MKKIIIIGGVAGGASCAARLRRLDENAKIIMIEKSGFISYANCGLPYYVGDIIKNSEDLILQTPQSFFQRFRVEVRTNAEVIQVDSENQKVKIREGKEESEETYDYLVLAPGTRAKHLFDNEDELCHLKNVEDAIKIKKEVEKAKKIAIIGGGFIGLELAENIRSLNKDVTIFEYGKHILANMEEDLVSYAENELKKNKIRLLTSSKIIQIVKENDLYRILLSNESEYIFDFVIVAAGVEPNTAFLKNSRILMDRNGFILVDEKMRTSIANVYACGDAISCKNFISGRTDSLTFANPANRQGRIIADQISGIDSYYEGGIGTNILRLFECVIGSTGLTSKWLKKNNMLFQTISLHPYSHATYYPGYSQIHTKLFYDPKTEQIFGCQAVGKEGVDKLIDVIATAIKLEAKVTDLRKLELSYAPSFLTVKSSANYFGFVSENCIQGLEELIDLKELENSNDLVVLDVRTNKEYEKDHLKNCLHIPLDELRDRIDELKVFQKERIYVYCAVGIRAHIASRILRAYGYETVNITGGFTSYQGYRGEKYV